MLKRILQNPELKFAAVFLFSTTALSVALILLAVIVDPYNIFGLNIFKPILLTNRTEKLRLLAQTPNKPKVIILGSSRVFKMDPVKIEKLTGLKTFNASVSYARPEEHLALSKYIVRDLHVTPKLFVVGVNLGEFNFDKTDPQTINSTELRKYLSFDRKTRLLTNLRVFKDRFNSAYLKDIFITIFWNSRGFPNPVISFGENGGQIFDRENKPNAGDIELTANLAMDLFINMPSLSPERKKYFEEFLAFAKEENIGVVVFLLPLPAQIQESLKDTTVYQKVLQELLSASEEWEKNYALHFFDFSSVTKFNGLPDDFDDSTHPSHRNIDLMTEEIFKKIKL